ncbi:serine/threonine protein kinase [Actinomadura madurae]|uniref:serine/threonine-protein kinase n=1 Tax=Actinomadura madurae TaxID=1993 RepID=UPI0020D20C58|nr:serine/threonine-protein kinase [Actinomadura madurae]MCP9950241.1 serine/threonine protein kinase [Actinomadura madurae]
MSQSERLVLATRYRLVSEIGQGANGTVWRGHDELLDRAVAIKELRLPEDLSEDDRVVFYRRTLREARAPAQLRTHSIVEVYDVVIEQGRPWIVMEMIEAPSLEQLIERSGPLPPDRVAHIGRALLDALNTAHKAGIVHRDLKPSNVLLDGDRVVLTDFGLAFSSGSASLTKTGHFMGSPAYVAPEVAAGDKATPRSDLWSLGATLYAALEGRPPFERENVMATLSALANESPPAPQNAGALAPVISGLLEKNPTRPAQPRPRRRPARTSHGGPALRAPGPDAALPADGGDRPHRRHRRLLRHRRHRPHRRHDAREPGAVPDRLVVQPGGHQPGRRAPGRGVQHAGRPRPQRLVQDLRVGAGQRDHRAQRRDAAPGRGAPVRPAPDQRGDLRRVGLRRLGERHAEADRQARRAPELHAEQGVIRPSPGNA